MVRENGPRGYDTKGTDVGRPPSGPRVQHLRPGHKVALVGGGNSGVYSLKTLMEQGINATLFEQSHVGVGGVWRSRGYGGVAYTMLRTNSSAVTTTAPAFPFPFELSSPFPHYTEILRYVSAYAEHHGLLPHIQFGKRVTNIRPVDPSKRDTAWHVTTMATVPDHGDVGSTSWAVVEGSEHTEVYDAVITCTGQYGGEAFSPQIEGVQHFKGSVMHSKQWRDNGCVRGKRVVVVGVGNSALDIALDAANVADSVFMSCRRGCGILSVEDQRGNPYDLVLLARSHHWQSPNLTKKALETEIHRAFVAAGMPPLPTDFDKLPTGMVKDTKTTLRHLRSGKLRLGPVLTRFTPDGVVLSDGTELAADVVVFCTGYDMFKTLSFIDDSVMHDVMTYTPSRKQHVHLYRMCLHPKYLTLALCGLVTSNANEGLIAEMQCRWVATMLRGECNTPTEAEVEEYIRNRWDMVRTVDPAHPRFIRYLPYMDSLARDLGCLPPIQAEESKRVSREPPKDPEALFQYNLQYGPATAVQWRLAGPHSWNTKEAQQYVNRALVPGYHLPPPERPFSWGTPPPARL